MNNEARVAAATRAFVFLLWEYIIYVLATYYPCEFNHLIFNKNANAVIPYSDPVSCAETT